MTIDEIAQALVRCGCPPQKCEMMARQLARKARMDADRRQIPYESALAHLIGLMAQGWASPGSGPIPKKD